MDVKPRRIVMAGLLVAKISAAFRAEHFKLLAERSSGMPLGLRRAAAAGTTGSGIRASALLAVLIVLPGQTPIAEWRFEEVFTVDLILGEVPAMSFGAPGELVVLDKLNAEFVVLDDSTGEVLRRVGRRGQGPGEFVQPQLLAATDAGKVLVFDTGIRRLSKFDVDGTYVSATTIASRAIGMEAVPEGLLVLRRAATTAPDALAEENHPTLSLETESGDDHMLWVWDDLVSPERGVIQLNSPFPIWRAVSETRVAVASSSRYLVTILNMQGDRVGQLRRDVTPTELSDEIKQAILASVPAAIRGTVEFETYGPLLGGIFPGPDETILVLRASPGAPPVFDVYTQGEDYIATVDAPEGFLAMAGRDGLVAGLVPQGDEVAVSVIRIHP